MDIRHVWPLTLISTIIIINNNYDNKKVVPNMVPWGESIMLKRKPMIIIKIKYISLFKCQNECI